MAFFPRLFFAVFLLFFLPNLLNAAPPKPEPTRILIVFDCSFSMTAKWDRETRMSAAKNILTKIVDSLKNRPEAMLALRCYGHQFTVADKNCTDTKLEVPFKKNNAGEIVKFVKKIEPSGWTPIAYSLTQAANDFPDKEGKNVIILITDGIEECEGDPCAVAAHLLSRNIVLKPYIIGIGLDDEKIKFFDCVGKYYNPKNEKELGTVFSSVIAQALDNTSMEVQLLNSKKQPLITDVEMTLINSKNGKAEYNYFHTMNVYGKPDTFFVDPNLTYTLQLNTVPPVYKQNIMVEAGKHTVVKVDAPQGTISLSCASAIDYIGLPCLVRRAGTPEVIFVQNMYTSQKYLTGNYDVEILSLPRINLQNVTLNESEPKKLTIPAPGKVDISYTTNVIGSIYIWRNNTQEWVTDINGTGVQRKELYLLQPGRYIIVYRNASSKKTTDTHEKSFQVISNSTVTLKLD